MNSSSHLAYYAYKLFALILLFFGLAGLHGLLFPEQSILNTLPEDLSKAEIVYLTVVLCLLFPLAKFMFFRIRIIRYDNENVEITNGSKSRTLRWEDVQSVSKVFAATPPLYRMTFKDDSEPAYFVMTMFACASIGFWSWDFSGFYKYAQERIAHSNDALSKQ